MMPPASPPGMVTPATSDSGPLMVAPAASELGLGLGPEMVTPWTEPEGLLSPPPPVPALVVVLFVVLFVVLLTVRARDVLSRGGLAAGCVAALRRWSLVVRAVHVGSRGLAARRVAALGGLVLDVHARHVDLVRRAAGHPGRRVGALGRLVLDVYARHIDLVRRAAGHPGRRVGALGRLLRRIARRSVFMRAAARSRLSLALNATMRRVGRRAAAGAPGAAWSLGRVAVAGVLAAGRRAGLRGVLIVIIVRPGRLVLAPHFLLGRVLGPRRRLVIGVAVLAVISEGVWDVHEVQAQAVEQVMPVSIVQPGQTVEPT